jgi:hypothetical protein
MGADVDYIKAKAGKAFNGREEVLVAYLYGSVAKGKDHIGSDVDVGVVLAEGFKPGPFYESRLSAELCKAFGAEAEVRVLNGQGIVFLHQVLKYGVLLFSRDEKTRVGFEADTYSRYLDFLPFFEGYNKERARRVLA